jgi:hypothetical protein
MEYRDFKDFSSFPRRVKEGDFINKANFKEFFYTCKKFLASYESNYAFARFSKSECEYIGTDKRFKIRSNSVKNF